MSPTLVTPTTSSKPVTTSFESPQWRPNGHELIFLSSSIGHGPRDRGLRRQTDGSGLRAIVPTDDRGSGAARPVTGRDQGRLFQPGDRSARDPRRRRGDRRDTITGFDPPSGGAVIDDVRRPGRRTAAGWSFAACTRRQQIVHIAGRRRSTAASVVADRTGRWPTVDGGAYGPVLARWHVGRSAYYDVDRSTWMLDPTDGRADHDARDRRIVERSPTWQRLGALIRGTSHA